MKTITVSAHLVLSIAGLIFSGATLAQSTWDWNVPCNPATCAVTVGTGTVTATVSAFGAETAGGNFAAASIFNGSNSYLGITSAGENSTSPNHSIDNFRLNSPGSGCTTCSQGGADYAEALLINFTQAVSLTQVAVSWTSTDSDAMIFRFDGGTGAQQDLLQVAANSLPTIVGNTANGWTLVSAGQFSTTSGQQNSAALNFASGLFSSYWLISTALGQSSGTKNNDGFKVSTFTGNVKPNGGGPPDEVPEPGSLALAAAGLLGLTISRRRFKRS